MPRWISCHASSFLAASRLWKGFKAKIIQFKCTTAYNLNVWKRYDSGELLYSSTSPQGNLSLGNGSREDTGSAQVYKFKNGNYKYQVLGGKGDRQGKGTLEVFENDRSIMSQTCTPNG
ncbi:MAG: hypothetical protein V7L11_06450 [Nostoc sp.]|uniref:hypothetical protein n=1 Tax=Nostoc sp. TaxID=1180 RepID=UPI002FF52241